MRQHRGRRKYTGEWVYGWLVVTDKAHYIIPNGVKEITTVGGGRIIKRNDMIEVIPETVGQSTGLKDRNGREIYEGDVLRIVLGDYVHVFVATSVEDVCYLKNISRFVEYSGYETDGIEVIGNIYESPELLKGDENT